MLSSMKSTWLALFIAALSVSAFKGVDAFPERGSQEDFGLNKENEELKSLNKSEKLKETTSKETVFGLLTTCNENEMTCKTGECVSLRVKCDGYKDCSDGADEAYCRVNNDDSTACYESEMPCKSGLCVMAESWCDGLEDCNDGSDETDCVASISGCGKSERACKSGLCVMAESWCDGVEDCDDESDEADCVASIVEAVIHKDSSNNQPCPVQKSVEKPKNETISISKQLHIQRDVCDVYIELIALRLCILDEVSKNIAMNEIDNTLFRATRDYISRQRQQSVAD